jgi:hypothetical protein
LSLLVNITLKNKLQIKSELHLKKQVLFYYKIKEAMEECKNDTKVEHPTKSTPSLPVSWRDFLYSSNVGLNLWCSPRNK